MNYQKIAIILSLLFLSSCTQRGCQRWQKTRQYTDRKYVIEMYSGGNIVYRDIFKGIINGEEGTDGFFYFKGDTLIEISGDYVIKSID